ncbi:metabolite traffic protein EboE [Halomonas sp. McH1-25]|uniref:metabolite traffic protein EboE n=1 Tax=unclassified Halomonas TaxID=2609666 RepID=UPI001EF4F4A5|nr:MULTISPECIES: metabolite traffic protein EboE [unclassified Halomonas]MCG7602018.1 metabolite traffic protein EboE [Halomonas sp. McH1-25]MCP1344618.1 metabolite traffic protein EboE [Halomonas sp. FL8]MCP1360187.1 metabolite traffic protein EboE [Halomonas sp. BBD45]MCP1367261.1 metabolite traffic protein EboE [Halomonas sp. BBD48]
MRLPNDRGDLTYCLNIHPAETWPEVRQALLGPVRAVRQTMSPDEPFAVGLRLSAQAMHTLEDSRVRAELKDILASQGYRAVTVNGFPYGTFHGVRVKEDVYQPDWRYTARLEYTCALAALMAELGAAGDRISLSTVPGTFKPLGPGNEASMADNLLKAAAHCAGLERRTGVCVAIAIEPEPYCLLATIDEAIEFFQHYLLSEAALHRFAELAGVSSSQAAIVLPRHLGLCYDVCHAAVEFEDPQASIARLREAGIPIHKLQLSAALRVAEIDARARHALEAFAEPTYLHQVVAKGRQGVTRYADLPEALARGHRADGEEWRIHYHVPIFAESLGEFGTTQAFLAEILDLHRQSPICSHLEVETYTWHVLPEALKHERIEEAIACELRWVAERLA